MGKKRLASCKKVKNRTRYISSPYLSKKAQITIFMIVGVIILFTFIFLFQLVNSAQKEKLSSEQEKVFTKAFKKEAMRIYVEDCLSDELEEALIILGQQGRVWSDQPGGIKEFSADINGVENPPGSGNRLSYGLAKTQNLQYENSYPCHNKTNSSPEFCQYKFPENDEGFGELDLKTSTIRNDLRRYLINRTVDCIINYTKTNISNKADVEIEELSLGLDIETDGININAEFPLKFSLGKEEFFHLSQFDFFYPTQFKWLLEAAVVRPLFYDWKYLDFNYTEETLQQPTFNYASNSPECVNGTCTGTLFYDKYSSLGITMQKEENENGDDIFIFSSPEVINRPGFYEFKVARQNRPPALDYINRSQCLAADEPYDYLVIPDDEELGDINITLFALDPDEDNVTFGYKFECDDDYGNLGAPPPSGSSFPGFTEENYLNLPKADLSDFPPSKCTLTSIVVDEHDEADWQETRILIDRPITLNISLQLPYPNVSSKFTDYYFVSREDPIYINITWPQNSSVVSTTDTRVNLTYTHLEGVEDFSYSVPSLATVQGDSCINFPWTNVRGCNLDDYEQDFFGWETHFNLPFSHFKNLTEKGVLNLTFAADYCSDLTKEESISANIAVKECVPYRNEQHPFSYPYEKYEFYSYDFANEKGNYTGNKNTAINPFLATHSCCKGDLETPGTWGLKDKGKVCFINPEPGCYGQVIPGNKILEKQVRYCNGNRGNICNGEEGYELSETSTKQKELRCGYNDNSKSFECSGITDKCQGELSFSYIDTNGDGTYDKACGGIIGCGPYASEIVYAGGGGSTTFSSAYINQQAKELLLDSGDLDYLNKNFEFKTKCTVDLEGNICDNDFDTHFDGVCKNSFCCGDGGDETGCVWACSDGIDNDGDGLWDVFEAFDYVQIATGKRPIGGYPSGVWLDTEVGDFRQGYDYIDNCKNKPNVEEQVQCAITTPNAIKYVYGPSITEFHTTFLTHGETTEIPYDFSGHIEGFIKITLFAEAGDIWDQGLQSGIKYNLYLKGDHSDPDCDSLKDDSED